MAYLSPNTSPPSSPFTHLHKACFRAVPERSEVLLAVGVGYELKGLERMRWVKEDDKVLKRMRWVEENWGGGRVKRMGKVG